MASSWKFCEQDEFLPGMTRRTVAEALERRFGASGASTFRGRDLAGWYLQQVHPPPEECRQGSQAPLHTLLHCCFGTLATDAGSCPRQAQQQQLTAARLRAQFIKLGAASALPGLSRHFVVWDADMVPLRPLRLFHTPRRRLGQGAPVQVRWSGPPRSTPATAGCAGLLNTHELAGSAATCQRTAAGHVWQPVVHAPSAAWAEVGDVEVSPPADSGECGRSKCAGLRRHLPKAVRCAARACT